MRDELCRGKESAEEWLEVHRTWHQMGGRSTATMLYGHIETLAQRVDHLRQLRELQDETGGFTGFVPFAFEPQTTVLAHMKRAGAVEELRNLAVSRIYLDNFDHLTAYWVSLGLPLAQISLSYGVDDLHGTIIEEKIFHMAGAKTPQEQTVSALENAIREAGRVPVQRDSYYHHLRRHPAEERRSASRGGRADFRKDMLPRTLLRIGCVQYLNAQPLIHGWTGPVDFDHPGALSQLANAELDVALVSSFEFLRNPIYAIADGVCLAADGPVYSVFLALAGRLTKSRKSSSIRPRKHRSTSCVACWPNRSFRTSSPRFFGRRAVTRGRETDDR